MSRFPSRLILLLLVTFAAAGCYRNIPLKPGADPPNGAQVVLQLHAQQTNGVERLFGADAKAVSGRVLRVTPDSIALNVARVDYGERPSAFYGGQEYAISRSSVGSILQRKAHTRRSLLLGVAIAASMFGISRLIGLDGVFGIWHSGGPSEPN